MKRYAVARWPVLAVLCAMSGLAGCGSDKEERVLSCPPVRFLREATRVTQFVDGAAHRPDTMIAEGELADYTGTCTYDKTGVTVDVELALVARRGPALKTDRADFRYFVSVIAPDRSVLARQVFDTDVSFPTGAIRAGSKETLQQHIPLPAGVDGGGHTVVVGFQLDHAQYDYNRALLDRRAEPLPR